MFIATEHKHAIRKGFLSKKVSLFYQVNLQKEEIALLLFWDNKQNPKQINY